jgi:UDP-glucose 4-epimerase
MKITVTGGSGFLGSHVADALSKEGHEVTIFDKKFSKWIRKDQKMCIGNILNPKDLERAIKGARAVYHFAGLADLEEAMNQPVNSVKLNILGTVLVLNLCKKYKVKRFIHASTIYVNSIEGGFYRSSKRAAEDYVEEYNKIHNLEYTILRFGSLYGQRSDKNNGVKIILKDAIFNNEIQYTGSKKTVRRYIHVLDAARACIDSLNPKYKNKYLTITGKKEIKITVFLKNLAKMLKIAKKIKFKNIKNVGHYETTPFTYKLKKGQVYKQKKCIDIYDGVFQLVQEIKNKKTK